jgi:hypothetical protein
VRSDGVYVEFGSGGDGLAANEGERGGQRGVNDGAWGVDANRDRDGADETGGKQQDRRRDDRAWDTRANQNGDSGQRQQFTNDSETRDASGDGNGGFGRRDADRGHTAVWTQQGELDVRDECEDERGGETSEGDARARLLSR